MELDENFRKLCTEVTYENCGIAFQELTSNLPPQMQNQAIGVSQNLDDFYNHLADFVSDTGSF